MPQRRQNSIVRVFTSFIFGVTMLPSPCSMSVQAIPRQPSSAASAKPTGPPPTIRTGVWLAFSRSRAAAILLVPRRSSFFCISSICRLSWSISLPPPAGFSLSAFLRLPARERREHGEGLLEHFHVAPHLLLDGAEAAGAEGLRHLLAKLVLLAVSVSIDCSR